MLEKKKINSTIDLCETNYLDKNNDQNQILWLEENDNVSYDNQPFWKKCSSVKNFIKINLGKIFNNNKRYLNEKDYELLPRKSQNFLKFKNKKRFGFFNGLKKVLFFLSIIAFLATILIICKLFNNHLKTNEIVKVVNNRKIIDNNLSSQNNKDILEEIKIKSSKGDISDKQISNEPIDHRPFFFNLNNLINTIKIMMSSDLKKIRENKIPNVKSPVVFEIMQNEKNLDELKPKNDVFFLDPFDNKNEVIFKYSTHKKIMRHDFFSSIEKKIDDLFASTFSLLYQPS